MKKVISFVAITLLMAACGGSPIQPTRAGNTPVSPAAYSVVGTVFEATPDGSRGVANATVAIGHDSRILTAATDENGGFSLEGVKAGTWQLFVSKEGYETQILTLDLQASQTVEVELRVVAN